MKKQLLSLLLLPSALLAQNVNIPDANFKAYLVGNTSINTNGDSEIQVSEAQAFTGAIFCPSLNITDLTGIEAFTSITDLQCQNNQLTSLDVSNNTALTQLICRNNQITNLNISENTALLFLFCENNLLTNLDVSNNSALLDLWFNQNQLSSINISNLTNLNTLICTGNQLTSLNVSNNVALTQLLCTSNQITSLNVSNCPNLNNLLCNNNQLTSLNVANGNNATLGQFKAHDNPSLTCIQVDDVAYSAANWISSTDPFDPYRFDPNVSFCEDCASLCTVTIPDANFKSYLVGISAINTNGDAEIQCQEATNYVGGINVDGLNIADLTGIEAFTSITDLQCQNNQLTSLDVSSNTALTQIICRNNQITNLNISGNTSLLSLFCENNLLTNLDVSNNSALIDLWFNQNQLSSINISNLTNLNTLICTGNQLTSLNVSANVALTQLLCTSNQITSLNVSNCPNLNNLLCNNNQLTSLNVANGNNVTLGQFKAHDNPSLTCIQVDDVAYSTANWISSTAPFDPYRFDPIVSFSENCVTFLSVSTNTIDYSIKLFPNPTKEVLNIEIKEVSQIKVLTILGELVMVTQLNSGNNTVDVSSYPSGVYLIQVTNEDGSVNQTKFIKE
jgi:Leucine-rich repeat (LRR) protein